MKSNALPPRLAQTIFSWYCRNAAVEDLEGDVEELYYKDVQQMPLWHAKLRYWKLILSLIFSYAVRQRKLKSAVSPFASRNTLDLLVNYLKIASRTLAKNRFFTIINVAGLAIGMSVSLLFIAMVSYVSRYDEFHANKERIYRVITETQHAGDREQFASSPPPLAEKISREVPGVDQVVRITKDLSGTGIMDKTELPIEGYFADQTFFHVFTFPMLKGNPGTALRNPRSIVLTETTAKRFCRDADALGKVITIEGWGDFEITGIMKDHPKASHLQFQAIASYSTLQSSDKILASWGNFRNHYTYVLLNAGYEAQLLDQYLTRNNAAFTEGEATIDCHFQLQPLTSIAPGIELSNQIGPEWGYTSFSIFAILTLLILVPASFNYTNITISRMLKRAKEIGLRKTVGGQRSQIFFQFITETVLVCLVALAGAFLIFTQVRQEFLNMLVSSDALELPADTRTIALFIIFAVATGFLAGVVPAWYFSRLNPVQAMKNPSSIRSITGVSFRKVLIVGQFALSLGFIMAVVIVLKQYRASLSYDFGFAHANILDVELQNADVQRFETEFSKLSSVNGVSMSSGIIGTNGVARTYISRQDDKNNDSLQVAEFFVDASYLKNLEIPLIAGTTFPDGADMQEEQFLIVNEEFVQHFNHSPADALGEVFVVDDSVEVRVIGVVKNFHYASLREPIQSFIFRTNAQRYRYANLKVSSTDPGSIFEDLEATWRAVAGEKNFRARFFKHEIEEAYSFYFSMIKICGFLGFLALSISCLGLLGMVVYTAETRTKELGIRKVMGATSYQLAVLLSTGYLKLMAIAAVIATPITFIIFDRGLIQLQYYHFQIGAAEITLSLLIMFTLGAATVLSQTIKAGKTNPVDTLRSNE